MLFNSYVFVFLFFPLCLFGFYSGKKKGKAVLSKAFLVLMSFWFYGFLQPENIPVLLVSMAVNYGIYHWMQRSGKKKISLATGLIGNIFALFLFKYTNSSFVPLGISFFTFQQIAFLMETYRGNLTGIKPLDYCFYIAFFPKLLEGPITLPHEMQEQAEQIGQKTIHWERIFRGSILFILGLAKKVLLADTFGRAVDYGYLNLGLLNAGDGLIVMLSYAMQLYFDFSGYCDMAMGIANMLGMELPLNFNAPYKAANIIEFWKGWHITLTRFFTRYLYIPLGGSRKGRGRTCLNILLVFLVSGIWHGAGLTFLIWGLMHGVLYAATRWWQEKKQTISRKKQTAQEVQERGSWGLCRVKRAISVAVTFLFVNIAWVFFRAPSVKEARQLLGTIVGFQFGKINWDLAACFNLDEFWYVIKVLRIDSWQYAHYILTAVLLLAALVLVFFTKTAVTIAGRIKPSVKNVLIMAVLLVWCIVTFSEVTSFIYLNF